MRNLKIILPLLLLFACRKADLPTPESENIIGEWEWIESTGEVSGNGRITPESESETRQFEFKKNGKYRECIDEKREDKGDYVMFFIEGSGFSGYELSLLGDATLNYSLAFKGTDTIALLPSGCSECLIATYVRK